MMLLSEAYEKAVGEINARATEIQEEFKDTASGMISFATCKEMSEKQWLFGNLYALKNRRKIDKPKETKETKDDK